MGTKDFKTEMMKTAGDVIGMDDPHYRYNLRDIRKSVQKRGWQRTRCPAC